MEKREYHDFLTSGSERDKRYFLAPLILSIVALGLQIATNTNYGIFTDELYFVACGNHLQFGYVDHPAIAPLVTRISMLFGKSLIALRFFPALAGSLTVLLSALIARELGGSRFAAALSSSTILFGMVFWIMFGMMGVNAFDVFFVTLVGMS
ncbi:MAG: phospholipid carrier-dependent glycosyltransferase [Nitrospiraceae bacterium]|nr:MAG: phospholipid carrier-dependent glycosyltransferase [Nitrospiraceae bacterium]RPH81228.1 MAG: phospholipid carrier-dependent glycosyltransferase [Nitrospiraceae bacterium]